MHLKSLEVQGFKSFADKIKFEFHEGITGIVGPNGSGKSNVGDAMRWVLGEQSAKQLRGGSMQDVIFNGTEVRKPLGYAYVCLTLDNSDHALNVPYDEVSITRRVYRSGESEYLINNAACRLREIQELFFDTGVGREGYSIIGQGQIDRIISGRPEERRALFDEAAGIVKYKKRKAAAEKSLADEEANMVRVEDILKELESRVGPLNEEADKAQKYLKYRDNLKDLDIELFLHDYDENAGKIKEIDEKLLVVSSDKAANEKELEKTDEGSEDILKQIDDNDAMIEKVRDEITQNDIDRNTLVNGISLIEEQMNTVRLNKEHYTERRSVINSEILSKEAEIEKNISSIKEASEKARKTVEALDQASDRVNELTDEKKAFEIEQDEVEKASLKHRQSGEKVAQDKVRFDTRLEQISIKKSEINAQIIANKAAADELNETAEEEKDNIDDYKEKLESIDDMNKAIEEAVRHLKLDALAVDKKVNDLQPKYHMANSKLIAIRSMTERYEGFGQSIRRVMERKESLGGIYGVVADLIKTEPEYETAIETALGGQIQNVVTSDQQTAKELISYLKKNRYGRATFLPLDALTVRGTGIDAAALREPGVIGTADALVNADKKFDKLVEYLLSRVIVVDNIDNAIRTANKYSHRFRMVTLEGDLINPGGSMSGGAFKNSNNLLGRRREIEDLEGQVEKLEHDLTAAKKELREKNEAVDKERLKTVGNQKLRSDIELKLNTSKVNYERALKDLEDNKAELDRIMFSLREAEEDEKNLIKESQDVIQNKEDFDKKTAEYEQKLIELSESIKGKEKDIKAVSDRFSELNIESEKEKQGLSFLEETGSRLEGERKKLLEELDDLQNDNTNYEDELKKKQDQIEAKRQEIRDSDKEGERLSGLLEEYNEKKRTLSENNRDILKRHEELKDLKNSLEKEEIRLNNQKEKLAGLNETSISYMWEQYGMTFSSAEELRNSPDFETHDPARIKKDIAELRKNIKELGSVNVNSIDEALEVNKRYDLLSSQHDDIVNAAEKLKGIIQDLDRKMRETFTSQFSKINESFNEVFKELFGGGRGSLKIADDTDVLTSDITIIAQPPGKKLVNIMQMSGGEKALTAIAILFSIQKLKPSPFCLLDEIDAALDDANVERFADYIHRLTRDTQFIVITHRRGTMNTSDILYGITMQEKGVSTLVSVNLVDALDQAALN
ncbi:MAG: chromosome segregation protein SMC [Lachnospiraceae bacterium]|jgi:chromosome segregation protein|nr:chromosome segregation protein SMC [Lachnospiraceae bacterium]MEE3460391.1 chromosome segregation protein SMC [Lachnospiraceae bacterium]